MRKINNIEQYRAAERQYNRPYKHILRDTGIDMDIFLRVEILRDMFGRDFAKANNKFYRFCWEYSFMICEECLKPLREYSSVFVSHIFSRSGYREMAIDPRNVNILCPEHHTQWEDEVLRKRMMIYEQNKIIMEKLKSEYNDYYKGHIKTS